jgi:putative protease
MSRAFFLDGSMKKETVDKGRPAILAPAGNKASFLAAIAAGADGVYCGLSRFSARMEARNFSLEQLASLTRFADERGTQVYVALNSLLKSTDLDEAGIILDQLAGSVRPRGIIIQDLGFLPLVRQTGFAGEVHLSTLANVSFGAALGLVKRQLGVDRVVIPRELDIDQIKAMAQACPDGLSLEVFVHGALCYGVSGRCYWSSYLGGKSGLRGRCVQPCRRVYAQGNQKGRFFSCQDLSLDVLAKLLLPIRQISAWKIEGRKKGPHYVYYTVMAYRMFRDEAQDPKAKREALLLLEFALGRPGTHYFFLPQRPQAPVNPGIQAGSGLLIGRNQGTAQRPYIRPREDILSGDVLRIGYEDEGGQGVFKAKKFVPKKGRLDLKISMGDGLEKGTPVFLVDRRETELGKMLNELEEESARGLAPKILSSGFHARLPNGLKKKDTAIDLHVYRDPSQKRNAATEDTGYWMAPGVAEKMTNRGCVKAWWWLPPVVLPNEEEDLRALVRVVLKRGGRNFVLNAPWQMVFFEAPKDLHLWAGPFCNLTNPLAVDAAASLGFSGAVVSPELGREDFIRLPEYCPIPLGVVVFGHWPLSMGRSLCDGLDLDTGFSSPKGEEAWVSRCGADYWVYPNWVLDIRPKKDDLQKAGYTLFVHIYEPVPRSVHLKQRPGLWNWDVGLA